jgi:hypothetical protein
MSGDGQILRCRWCQQLVPWGPAAPLPDADLELYAAMAATQEPAHGRYLLAICLHMSARGWPGLGIGTEYRRLDWAGLCEELALTIWHHDRS